MAISQKEMDDALREIKAAFDRKKAPIRCPVCLHDNLEVQQGYLVHILQDKADVLKLSGQSIPTVPAVCTNCGVVYQFSLGVLGLLNKEKNNGKK